MVKRTYDLPNEEPGSFRNELPSEGNHVLQVVDVFTCEDETGMKLNLDENTVSVRLEVAQGSETGFSLLHRLTLDENNKGFFATRLFLKAIHQPCKGPAVVIDTDTWAGEQFRAYVTHNKGKNGKVYANIFSYDDSSAPLDISTLRPVENKEVAWDEDMK